MPHYRATPESHASIAGDGLLLIDSGAQYLGGTTDITRMWPIGRISDGAAARRDAGAARHDRAVSRTRFPRGTLSPMLDAIARAPLWEHGLDYGHGTGHGVGYFLNVHEGPQSFSRVIPEPTMAMQPGMITSIEPGLYRPGPVGRAGREPGAERAGAADSASEFGEFLEFETLTLCPIDARCIEPSLLRADEIAWLNALPRDGRERLAPLVSRRCARLADACAPRRSPILRRASRRTAPAASGARRSSRFGAVRPPRPGFVASRFRRGAAVPRVRSIASRECLSRSPP